MNSFCSKVLLFISYVVIFSFGISSFISKSYASHVVWPEKSEGGTFYLSLSRDTKSRLFPRKGYISAGTPIILATNSDGSLVKHKREEQKYGTRFVYYEFTSATGIRGQIKFNSVKDTTELSKKNRLNLISGQFRHLVAPISPSSLVTIELNQRLLGTDIHTFSRSSLEFVVTDNEVTYLPFDGGEVPVIKVRFFQALKSGKHQIREGWIRYEGNHDLFKIYDLQMDERRYIDVKSTSLLSRLTETFDLWFNEYDDNKLAKAFNKSCNKEVTLSAELKLGVESPFPYFTVGTSLTGQTTYTIPKDYRFSAESFIENSTGREVRLLKTIKCKPNSNADWYAEHAVVGGTLDRHAALDIFHDDTFNRLKGSFDLPIVAGRRTMKNKMLRIKQERNDSKQDYFTAFSHLDQYLEQEVFADTNFGETEKLVLKAFLAEQLVEYK